MSWGGSRSGAGAPKRGVSQARRLLVTALQRGLEQAGRQKGLTGSPEDVATAAAAHIACDMVLAGRGDEVLKLYALATPVAEGEGTGSGSKSALMQALEQLPGMVEEASTGPDSSLTDGQDDENTDESEASASISGDAKSPVPQLEGQEGVTLDEQGQVVQGAQPFFDPAPMLIPPSGFELAGSRGAYGGRAAKAPATPHTPPGGHASGDSLHGKNFDSGPAEEAA